MGQVSREVDIESDISSSSLVRHRNTYCTKLFKKLKIVFALLAKFIYILINNLNLFFFKLSHHTVKWCYFFQKLLVA